MAGVEIFTKGRRFPWWGWVGLSLAGLFWGLNWGLAGPRTHWGFFPMWLGYCLTIDALGYVRRGTSLLDRSWRRYAGLFFLSAPAWWLFEAINARLQNWHYQGVELFSPPEYWFWATLSFSTVLPAVLGAAELASTFGWIQRLGKGPVVRPTRVTTLAFFLCGWVMLAIMLAWPHLFFPFVWVSLYFILEPVNIWLGRRSLAEHTQNGDWRPVVALWIGVLLTAFFWELWNFYSYPKWIYSIPWGGCCKIFEMPLLGYGGYLPFALELFAFYHLVSGAWRDKTGAYVQIDPG